jgi:hypothetical protein
MDINNINQNKLDALKLDEIEFIGIIDREIMEPSRLLREYRYRFNQKRKELIRDTLIELINYIDNDLHILSKLSEKEVEYNKRIADPQFDKLAEHIAQIDTLLGSSVSRPPRWDDFNRHMYFGLLADLHDIINHDWPNIKAGLRKSLYGEKEAVPTEIEDLSTLVGKKPHGPVVTQLLWERLTDDDFERLIFVLISSENGYQNSEWLMKTNAPDKGRDLSAYRVQKDPLSGIIRQRVIIQCKHWLSKSVGLSDVAKLSAQMKLWEPPRVDVLIIATSGRFTLDAVSFIENHNQSDCALRIEMWTESKFEQLLNSRPALIAEFKLR